MNNNQLFDTHDFTVVPTNPIPAMIEFFSMVIKLAEGCNFEPKHISGSEDSIVKFFVDFSEDIPFLIRNDYHHEFDLQDEVEIPERFYNQEDTNMTESNNNNNKENNNMINFSIRNVFAIEGKTYHHGKVSHVELTDRASLKKWFATKVSQKREIDPNWSTKGIIVMENQSTWLFIREGSNGEVLGSKLGYLPTLKMGKKTVTSPKASTVSPPKTTSGHTCGKCSKWTKGQNSKNYKVVVKHSTIEEVRNCQS